MNNLFKKPVILVGLLIVLIFISVFLINKQEKESLNTNTVKNESNTEERSSKHSNYEEPESNVNVKTIVISSGEFEENPITVPLRSIIAFNNLDKVNHHIIETEPMDGFDSGVLEPNTKISVKEYDEAGTYLYECKLHPNEKGTIIVEE